MVTATLKQKIKKKINRRHIINKWDIQKLEDIKTRKEYRKRMEILLEVIEKGMQINEVQDKWKQIQECIYTVAKE